MKGNYKKAAWKGKASNKVSKQIDINFFIIDKQKIGIQIPYGYCVQVLKNHIRDIGEGIWSYDDKCWIIKRASYPQILQKIQDHFWKQNNQQQPSSSQPLIKVNPIDEFVFTAESTLHQPLTELHLTNLKPYTNTTLKYNSVQTLIDPESLPFFNKLFDFQKQSVRFGIRHHGRMLLADQMGVGKTIQSLALAYVYKHEWPLLVVCPPTLKINWQNQIRRWYPDIQQHQIQLVNNSKTAFRVNVQIMIISYDLAWRMKDMFEHVRIVIADEAHYLKSADSKRSQALVPFLSTRKRVILLTGTPAFARPKQIYNLITIVRPNIFKNFKLFGNRYCDPKWNHWSHTYEYNGCKNVKELHYILKDNIMIRRLKADVLKELPDKNRQKIVLETDASVVRNIKDVLDKNNISKMETFFTEYLNKAGSNEEERVDKREEIMQAYRLSGIAKIKAIKEYIDEILQNGIKILVFAHHIKVMDEIESELRNKKHKFIRIDGTVTQNQRAENVEKFQTDPEILVALLSITAAGVGITLTAASTVIFAELHWTPALMLQAEDRAHRVGQKDSVNCHYLIGENTLDQMLYRFLERKVLNVSGFVDGERKDLEFQELERGEKGKFSKREEVGKGEGQGETPNKVRYFGSGLMEEFRSATKRQIDPNQQSSSQMSQLSELTDISVSTDHPLNVKPPSRKKPPSKTLDSFVMRKHPTPPVKGSGDLDTELKYSGREENEENERYIEQEKEEREEKYEMRRSMVFRDDEEYFNEQRQQEKRQFTRKKSTNKKGKKPPKSRSKSKRKPLQPNEQTSIQSSSSNIDDFDHALNMHLKNKSAAQQSPSSSSQKGKYLELTQSPTKSIERNNSKGETKSPQGSSTQTVENDEEREFEI